ncbi:HTH-type transcriptional repressor FabR [Wenzhouxiangella marina]|uniref:TetR family transcriptional regulator n=1 Tax=Wenzhouxiangella marina TaxID=1579979 RepID=A0A0K0XVD9_9GAMM|nr:HTH-type transcriptional repressor FabR [Wenzhouxiangella marina]AKS41586.1 TetR family transcriptional regulator [Wenzhouxiangella marina]MBB6086655.1 AcrR family transcriptional regulator [Wenzhouxiangella marina]
MTVTRRAQKQRTRELLLDAALGLMDAGRGFSSLSLREITREAGVVPAAFYRHFADLDELGLALVDACGLTLRRLLREARREGLPPTQILRSSVLIYKNYVSDHHRHFRFAVGARGGGSPSIRRAIRNEETHFAREMAQDMRELGLMPQLPMETLEMICALVVTTMMNAATDILDLPPGQPQAEQEMTENFVRQLRVIFLGARAWDPQQEQGRSRADR